MNCSQVDWNSFGLIAYANNLTINIIDAYSMKIKQTLENGKHQITKVKWSKVNGLNRPLIKLASSDEIGTITIWDTYSNSILNELKELNATVHDLRWKFLSNSKEILAVLYASNKIVVWDPSLGVKLINKAFNEPIFQFALNQVDDRLAIGLSNGSIDLYSNFFDKQNNSVDKKTLNDPLIDQLKLKCIQIEFNSVYSNLLIVLFSKDFFVFDLTISKRVSHVKIEKNSSPFIQVYSCSIKDILYLLHENGCISIYEKQTNQIRKQSHKNDEAIENIYNQLEVSYDYNLLYQSDPIRLTKSNRLFGFTICPTTQKHLSVLISDGRVLKYEILKKKSNFKNKTQFKEASNAEEDFLMELFNDEKSQLKMVLNACHLGQSDFNTNVIKMFNPLREENVQPLIAIGGSSGLIIYNFEKNIVDKKISIFNNSSINGIEWISSNSLILWSSPINESLAFQSNDLNSQLVKNEIILIDLRTGEFNKIRETAADESPIISIKLSHLKQYLIILFKDQPFEIWDVRNFTFIKRVSKRSPPIKILEWFSTDSNNIIKPLESSTSQLKENSALLQTEYFIFLDITGLMYSFLVENGSLKDSGKLIHLPDEGVLSNLTAIAPKKEFLIFGDSDGNLNKWNIKTKSLNLMASKLGSIRQLKFSNKTENLILLITLTDSVLIFDVAKSLIISSFKVNSKTEVVYSDWYSIDKIIIKLSNNIVKILNMELKQVHDDHVELSFLSSYRILSSSLDYLSLLNQNKKFLYKLVYDACQKEKLSENMTEFKQTMIESSNDKMVRDCMENINPQLLSLIFSKLKKHNSNDLVVKECNLFAFLTLYLNLSSFEVSFWSLMVYFHGDQKKEKNTFFDLIQKHSCMLVQNDYNTDDEFETLKLFNEKNNSNCDLVHKLILCDKKDHAFNVLIETNSSNEGEYLNNSFKAALIASFKNSNLDADAKTSIKLIATNLIANGKVSEGVEILCLIGLVLDACRYLQDNNDWEKAALLAKFRLSQIEYISIIKRWCDHLVSLSQMEFAILLLISCKQYGEALKFLNRTNYKEIAYFYMDILIKNNLISVNKESQETSNQIDEKLFSRIAKYYDNS